jgi:hypothetical protein
MEKSLVLEQEVIEALKEKPLSTKSLLIKIISKRLNSDKLTEESVGLVNKLDFDVRRMVYCLAEQNKVKFNACYDVELKV